jgi:hypothetical protein
VSKTVKRLKNGMALSSSPSSAAPMSSAVQGEAVAIDKRGAGLVLTNLGAQVDRLAEGEPVLASSGANHE